MKTLGYAEMVHRAQILKLFQKTIECLSLEHGQIFARIRDTHTLDYSEKS
jgi:hypothetical protein